MIIPKNFIDEQIERFKDADIEILADAPDVLVVKLNPNCSGWGICYFSFIKNSITCSGDIESFTLNTTWNTKEELLNGSTPKTISYLLSKLAHGKKLKEFNDELLEETIVEIKEEFGLSDENDYLLSDVCHNHLTPFDDWCSANGIDDSWEYYDSFYDYPAHAYIMLAMIMVIENKIKEKQ